MKKIIISETQEKILAKSIRQMINESQESKSIDAAKKLLISKGYTPEQADKFVRIDLRNDIPSLRDTKNAKFILGVTRMFLNRELSDATIILNVDKTIKLLTLAHYNEYDRNLNGLSAEELINRFADARSSQSSEKRNALSTRQFEKRDYNIVKINSFEEASKYSNYTSWCVTHGNGAFNSYTANGEAQFYFCLKNGFESIKPIKGENCPLDEYGLSMIAVCVDSDGDLKTCTCRWNHDNGGNDGILNEEQISNIVGVNFYQVFKPSNVLKEKIEALKGMTEIPDNYFENSKIKEITIPNSITKIGFGAFAGCDNLTSVTIPGSVTSIGNSAFLGCASLTSVTIGNGVTSTGDWAFAYCKKLTSITIPDSVTWIGGSAFIGCTSLESITIPNSVTEINQNAFNGCVSLTSVTIPDSVTSIGSSAFIGCTSLKSIAIGNSVTSIGNAAFNYCSSLTSVTIPNSVTSIGTSVFYGCSSLTSVTIPDSVTSIGSSAFIGCTSLKSIAIGNSVTSIGNDAFYGCESLISVTMPIRFKDEIDYIFEKTNANIRFYGEESISSNNNIQENMSNKKIIITEQQECFLAAILREETQQMPVNKKMNKPFCVNPEKVLIVKKFLDKGFSSHDYEKIGPDGFPKKIKVISMNASNGEPLKYMYQDQLHDLLIDKFQNMFADKLERASFLKQVIKDWLNNSITIFGGLSTNEILAENMTSEEVDIEASEANPDPTEGQKEASNYKMGHVVVMGMPISIETAKGNFRRYRNEDGTEGKNEMKNHYGYFKNTSGNGKDGDAVDVFIGPDIENCDMVYVVDQNNKKNEFDESKVMLGFKSIKDAKKAYLSNYSKDWKGFRDITGVSLSIFKKWLYRKHKQRKPFAEYVLIKKNKV